MSGVIESPASLARRRLHKIEDDTDGDGQLEAANGTTSKTEQQQPDEGSIIESKEAAVDQSTPTDDEPRNALAWLAPVFHLTMTVFYTLLLYYGITLLQGDALKLIDPKGKIPAYGGRFKFLTHINQWVQLFIFAFLFITDMIPRSSFKKTMTKLSDIAFTAVAFPLSWFIVITFWGIYAYDRRLVYPISYDKVVPSWLNHFWHTTIGVFVLFEVMLVYHRFPKSGMAACLSLVVNAAYLSWIGWVYGQTKFWVYPIMAVLPIPFLVLFIAGCMLFSFCLFFFGRHVSTLRWGPTNHHYCIAMYIIMRMRVPASIKKNMGTLDVATFFHLIMAIYNAVLLRIIRKIVRENRAVFDPRGEIPEYAGQFKYLTHINQWVQLFFFTLQFLLDLLPSQSTFKHKSQSYLSFTFATVIFPLAWYVATSFWAVYVYDSNLIYKEVSRTINHLSHTAIVLWVILEVLLQNHNFPNLSVAVVPIFACCLMYISWVEWIHVRTGFWVYPIFNTLPPSRFYFILFYGFSIFLCFLLYLIGRTLSSLFWGYP